MSNDQPKARDFRPKWMKNFYAQRQAQNIKRAAIRKAAETMLGGLSKEFRETMPEIVAATEKKLAQNSHTKQVSVIRFESYMNYTGKGYLHSEPAPCECGSVCCKGTRPAFKLTKLGKKRLNTLKESKNLLTNII